MADEEPLAQDQSQRHEPHLLERLEHLRTVVPVIAQELVCARRSAAQLRRENHRLTERIRELQSARKDRR